MSDLCKQECFAYAYCENRIAKGTGPFSGTTVGEIRVAKELLLEGDQCLSELPQISQDCRIVASAVLKNLIG